VKLPPIKEEAASGNSVTMPILVPKGRVDEYTSYKLIYCLGHKCNPCTYSLIAKGLMPRLIDCSKTLLRLPTAVGWLAALPAPQHPTGRDLLSEIDSRKQFLSAEAAAMKIEIGKPVGATNLNFPKKSVVARLRGVKTPTAA